MLLRCRQPVRKTHQTVASILNQVVEVHFKVGSLEYFDHCGIIRHIASPPKRAHRRGLPAGFVNANSQAEKPI
jgi:hypothetical protein